MTPAEIATSYDDLADQWNSENFPRESGIRQHERAIAFAKQRRRALDVGCGSSGRIIDLLKTHGFDVEGLDVSRRMIKFAKRRNPDVAFHHGDICEWELPRAYDFVSAWDSIWLQRARHSKHAEAADRCRLRLQAPGIRSISRAASVCHCTEKMTADSTRSLKRSVRHCVIAGIAIPNLDEVMAWEHNGRTVELKPARSGNQSSQGGSK